jgi:hypothetical protein
MNMPSPHLDDEALSAAVDGALDAGADHLRACAACRARRDQLAAARDALRDAPVDPLDELTRRRILARALDEAAPVSRPRPWYLRPAVGGIAAALVAVLAAVPLLLDRQDRSTDLAATGSAESAAPFLGDLGDVSDPAALRAALGASDTAAGGTSAAQSAERNTAADQAAPKSATPAPAAAPLAGPPAAPTQPYAARTESGPRLDPAAVQRCADVLTTKEAKGARVSATGTGTYRGQAVAVIAVDEGRSRRTAYVLAGDDCRILDRQRL